MVLSEEQKRQLAFILSDMIDDSEYEMKGEYVCPYCYASIEERFRECNQISHKDSCIVKKADILWDELDLTEYYRTIDRCVCE